MRTYEYRHTVGFQETNLVGNVYYANHILWQGRCRELFLRDYVPTLIDELAGGLCLITTRCSCEYLTELNVFDEIVVQMRLGDLTTNGISLRFEYLRKTNTGLILAARGEQKIVCMRRELDRLSPVPVPPVLRDALRAFE